MGGIPEMKMRSPAVPTRGNARRMARVVQALRAMTQQNLDERPLELAPPLQALVPPAHLCDKAVYSAFGNAKLVPWLKSLGVDTLIVSGGETDICVLATVMSAIDLGYRIVLATDALCSVSDRTHDALMTLTASGSCSSSPWLRP